MRVFIPAVEDAVQEFLNFHISDIKTFADIQQAADIWTNLRRQLHNIERRLAKQGQTEAVKPIANLSHISNIGEIERFIEQDVFDFIKKIGYEDALKNRKSAKTPFQKQLDKLVHRLQLNAEMGKEVTQSAVYELISDIEQLLGSSEVQSKLTNKLMDAYDTLLIRLGDIYTNTAQVPVRTTQVDVEAIAQAVTELVQKLDTTTPFQALPEMLTVEAGKIYSALKLDKIHKFYDFKK